MYNAYSNHSNGSTPLSSNTPSIRYPSPVIITQNPLKLKDGKIIPTGTAFQPMTSECILPTPSQSQLFHSNDWNATEDSLMKPSELQNLNLFFQQELNNTNFSGADLMFDQNEKEFFTNFLDGFLQEPPPEPTFSLGTAPPVLATSPVLLPLEPNSVLLPPNSLPLPTITNNAFQQQQQKATSIVQTRKRALTVPTPELAPRKKRHRSKELLTDKERKQNHILSEQKRRQNIRLGFHALSLLIPSLRDSMKDDGQHPSKSIVLTKSVDYLSYILKRNEVLNQRYQKLYEQLSSVKRVNQEILTMQPNLAS